MKTKQIYYYLLVIINMGLDCVEKFLDNPKNQAIVAGAAGVGAALAASSPETGGITNNIGHGGTGLAPAAFYQLTYDVLDQEYDLEGKFGKAPRYGGMLFSAFLGGNTGQVSQEIGLVSGDYDIESVLEASASGGLYTGLRYYLDDYRE